MKIRFIGHACFVVETSDGTVFIFDPFQPMTFGGRVRLNPFQGRVDAVISSHGHLDHRHIDPSFGTPVVVDGPGQYHKAVFRCVDIPHGMPSGRDHGMVRAFSMLADGINVVHLGDAGRLPDVGEREILGTPDVLLTPTGGRFTLDGALAAAMVAEWSPAIAVPMHHSHPDVSIDLAPVQDFLKYFDTFEVLTGPLAEFGRAGNGSRIIVMNPEGSRTPDEPAPGHALRTLPT